MAASRMDVARRLSAFEFACHAMDVAFSEVHCLPKIPRPALRDRGNPMELYDEEQFHARCRFTKNAVRQLLAMLPLQESGDNRGQPVPPMLHLLMALRFYGAGTFQTVTGDLVHIPQSTVDSVPRSRKSDPTHRKALVLDAARGRFALRCLLGPQRALLRSLSEWFFLLDSTTSLRKVTWGT
ncbi:hypothetical protein HPB52_017160 [Rhipicephalus sanguineus]|uniref:Nuclease HARBI1 n=1 Tax=Rhipicephalus sanguineus TaxID=34632 RepID=A0A9D4SUS4_RHISA|nr:hypothetical protein HPB52_017160 [Rhipicephalus sanguineus]